MEAVYRKIWEAGGGDARGARGWGGCAPLRKREEDGEENMMMIMMMKKKKKGEEEEEEEGNSGGVYHRIRFFR